jgi:hypothetical protein
MHALAFVVCVFTAAAIGYVTGWRTAISPEITSYREERRDRRIMHEERARFRRELELGTGPTLIPPPFLAGGGIVSSPGPVILYPDDFPLIRREDPRRDEPDGRP